MRRTIAHGKPIRALLLDATDDVATVLQDVTEGETIHLSDGTHVRARQAIPKFHKIALRDIPSEAEIRKYGEVIGRARCFIAKGDAVHTHNLVSFRAQVGD